MVASLLGAPGVIFIFSRSRWSILGLESVENSPCNPTPLSPVLLATEGDHSRVIGAFTNT